MIIRSLALVALLAVSVNAAPVGGSKTAAYTDKQRVDQLHKLYKMGILDRTEYRLALQKFRAQDLSGFENEAKLPEYVDANLLAEADRLRANYAKVDHLPSRARMAVATALRRSGGVLVLYGDEQATRPGQTTGLEFRQESNFIYTTGFDYPGARVIIGLDPAMTALPMGEAWLFVQKRNPVWTGLEESLQDFLDAYDVDKVAWIDDFDAILNTVIRPTTTLTLPNVRTTINNLRARKMDVELEMIKMSTKIAGEAHKALMANMECGMWESDGESLFRYVSHNYGMRFQSYIPIVGAGPNSAALHYNDGESKLPYGSITLVDAAPEIGQTRNGGGYTSDITRTWPCTGKYSPIQKAVYDAVFMSQNACIQNAVIGSNFNTATTAATLGLLQGLLNAGLVQGGTPQQMMTANIHRLFQPHSLGHSVGLDVHDPGSINPFTNGTVITCEPGCYFYPSLLLPAFNNANQARYLNRALLEEPEVWNMGGVRIEDIIVVTPNGPDIYSADIPRSSDEVEAFMMAAKKARLAGESMQATRKIHQTTDDSA